MDFCDFFYKANFMSCCIKIGQGMIYSQQSTPVDMERKKRVLNNYTVEEYIIPSARDVLSHLINCVHCIGM